MKKYVNCQFNSYLLFVSLALGLGEGLTAPHRRNVTVTKRKRQPRGWTDLLEEMLGLGLDGCGSEKGQVAGICERGNQLSLPTKCGEFLA